MNRTRWSNWVGNQTCDCEVVRVDDLAELQSTVTSAAAAGKRIRAAGGSYAWSELVPSRDVIVRVDKLDRLLGFDRQARAVEVECGMTIGRLEALVRQLGFTLISPPIFPRLTVGGALATGSHGAGFAVGSFSDQILELTIVQADGSLATVRRDDADYRAAKVALGTLGIAYKVKLELEPQFNVYLDVRPVPASRVLREFADLQKSCEFLELFHYPHQRDIWVYLMDRTESFADEKTLWRRLLTNLDTWVENFGAGWLIPQVACFAPKWIPAVNSIASRLANQVGASVHNASDAFHLQKAYPKAWDMSYAVPATEAERAWGLAIDLIEAYAQKQRYPVSFALHGRFTGPSDAWLGPEQGCPTCYVEVLTALPTHGWKEFYLDLEDRWLAIPGARPHWGKLFFRPDALRDRYPHMRDFLAVRERWDPGRVFLNRFLERDVFAI